MSELARRPLIAFLGDDVTGSSAVMELLTFAGLPSILFLEIPDQAELERARGFAGVGIASVARSKSPAWMDANLPAAFECLASLDAPIAQYKVCSTFDSAPHTGSIGKAFDLARPRLGGLWHPLLVAAPAINRFQFMGNLFAGVDGTGYRLDRHPTMAHHPVTPMHEADLGRHLALQTDHPIALVDHFDLTGGRADIARHQGRIVSIDVIDGKGLIEAGRLIWENRGERLLVIGSQGVQYALIAYWREAGLLGPPPAPERAERFTVAAVSGSCSPVTARQIEQAGHEGFALIRLDAARAADADAWSEALAAATEQAAGALGHGRSPLVFTASGPADPAIAAVREAIAEAGLDPEEVLERIGRGLGSILKALVRDHGLRRVCIAGGDSSGHALASLGVTALEARVELAPACALGIAHSHDPAQAGLEIALKGGQMGPPGYFGLVASGGPREGEDKR